MLKFAGLLFNTLALLIYNSFFVADAVTVTAQMPTTAKPDSEFTVELTINKGNVGGFAKLQHDLPEGFTASEVSSNGGSFTFVNQSVKIIWMSLPSDKELNVKYKVKTEPAITPGNKAITGKFSYVFENTKQTMEIPVSNINIEGGNSLAVAETPAEKQTESTNNLTSASTQNPTGDITAANSESNYTTAANTISTPTETVTSNDNTTSSPTNINTKLTPNPNPFNTNTTSLNIICNRKIIGTVTEPFTVEVTVNKSSLGGFAKLVERIPAGYTASSKETKGAAFTFVDQKAKFVWVSIPAEEQFIVSYTLTPMPNADQSQAIEGVFSYIENDQTKKYTLANNTIGNSEPGTQIAANTVTTAPEQLVAQKTEDVKTGADKVETVKVEEVQPPVIAKVEKEITKEAVKVNNTKTTAMAVSPKRMAKPIDDSPLSATNMPSRVGKVNYHIQIMALQRPVTATLLGSKLKIDDKISTEMADGFTKYMIGKYGEYKTARDARELVKNKGVVGPFVTAYNYGKRITVQEAIMITSQQWFR